MASSMNCDFPKKHPCRTPILVLVAALLVTTAAAACALAFGRESTLAKVCNVVPGIVTGILVAVLHDFFWKSLSPWKRWGLAAVAGVALGICVMVVGAIVAGLLLGAFGVSIA
jgi:hypothetical protein